MTQCSWCDGLAISILLDISLMTGSCEAGHWMGRQMFTDEILMVWVGSEWWHERQKGVATAVADIFKGVSYLKTSLNILATAVATPFRLSCHQSLPTHIINISSAYICLSIQWPAPQLPIINEMFNKIEIANPSHQLHFIASHFLTQILTLHYTQLLPKSSLTISEKKISQTTSKES